MAIYALDYVAASAQRGSFSNAAMVMDAGTETTLMFSIDLTTKADTFHYIISTATGLTTANVNIYYSQSSGNLAINMGTNLFYPMPADFEDAGARYLGFWHKSTGNLNEVWLVKQDGVSSAVSVGSFSDAQSIPGTRTWQVANRQDNTAARYANAEVGMLAKFDRALTTQEMEDLAHYVVEAKDLTNCAIYYPYSEGSGTTSTDTQQGAVFTTVNNPGWVLLDGGGAVTADVSATAFLPIVSASASATLPSPVANVSVSTPLPSVSASLSATLPQPSADVSFSALLPIVSAEASATLPNPSASVSLSAILPQVAVSGSATLPAPSASVSVTSILPTVSASMSATLPQPSADVSVTAILPQVSVSASATQAGFIANLSVTALMPQVSAEASATLPQPSASIAITAPLPSVSASASSTLPQWSASVNVTALMPQVSVGGSATLPSPVSNIVVTSPMPVVSISATVSGFEIVAAPNARITLEPGSNLLKLQPGSNRIKL